MQPSPATQSLQNVAQSLDQAAQQLGLMSGDPQGQQANSPAQANAGGAASPDGDSSDSGAREMFRLTDLEVQLQGISSRNWGELPGRLQTDILDSSQRRTGGDYGKIISRYFEEISRTRTQQNATVAP
jgi:hypothetical protein